METEESPEPVASEPRFGRAGARFAGVGEPYARLSEIARSTAFKDAARVAFGQNMPKYAELTGKLGLANSALETIMKNRETITAAARLQDSFARELAKMSIPSAATRLGSVGNWVPNPIQTVRMIDVPVNPVPDILRDVHAELAQANAAETARADAAEKRAAKAEARAERSEQHTLISIWLNVGMFILTMVSVAVTLFAILG